MRLFRLLERRPPRGFTLLEALLASVIFAVVVGAIYVSFVGNTALFTRGERMTDLQQNTRAALDLVAREIRMAGFTNSPVPAPMSNPGKDPNPIIIARNDLLVIRGNVDYTPPGGSIDFFYAVQSAVTPVCAAPPCLLRGAYNPPGVGAYSLEGAGATWSVIAYNVQSITFAYFDGNNAPLDPGAPPGALDGAGVGTPFPGILVPYTARGAVRRIAITITAADNRGALPGGGKPPGYTLWTTINIRNLEDPNLGPV